MGHIDWKKTSLYTVSEDIVKAIAVLGMSFHLSPNFINRFHITCLLLSLALGGGGGERGGGGATNNLYCVLNMSVSYSRYLTNVMINSTQSIVSFHWRSWFPDILI